MKRKGPVYLIGGKRWQDDYEKRITDVILCEWEFFKYKTF